MSKWKMHHHCSKNPEVRMSRYLDTSTKRQMAHIMVQHGRPSRSSSTKSGGSSSDRTIMGRALPESSVRTRLGKKFQIGNAYSLTEKKGLFLSVYLDDVKLVGNKQNIDPMWKVLMKEVDLGAPASFFYHVYLGCTQRECQTSKDM